MSLNNHVESLGDVVKIKGTVVLMVKTFLEFNGFNLSPPDRSHDFLGKVSFQLVSATVGDPTNGNKGKVGESTDMECCMTTLKSISKGQSMFGVTFDWDENYGIPGAFIVKNNHNAQFFLKTLTLDDVPNKGRVHFVCNSWVYPVDKYNYDRLFFANDTYLPSSTPGPLRLYREEELLHLRGDEDTGMLQLYERVYKYAVYNDLGDPDQGPDFSRPVIGGSKEYPYPRRGLTGRPPSKKESETESRMPLGRIDVYVPRDERFGHLKTSDFLTDSIKAVVQILITILNNQSNETPKEFDSFQDVLDLYEGGLSLQNTPELDEIKDRIPLEMVKGLTQIDGKLVLKLPLPQIIQDNKLGWRTDEEFGREMLAGANPVNICLLKEFPPTSKLDPKIYGNHNSSITVAHIEKNLEGLTVKQALMNNKLFILDHHEYLMPFVNRINNNTSKRIYATRSLLFLKEDGTLKPLAIELSLPHPDGEQHGVINKVFTPAEEGVEGSTWQLAKAYVSVNDTGIHQLINHWLNTHAAIEPFAIATNRQLSVIHPIYKLLSPHYRDTMNINALARQTLFNAGGVVEIIFFAGKYSVELTSAVYKNWKFTEQGLPADLLKRGVAVEDPKSPNKLRLLIEDYPYAVDGLAIWSAIETWVKDYCSVYYPNDATIQADTELQAWWKEVREVGHGDKKDEAWWPKMQTISELTQMCTTIIWVASALHAAVNFGQFAYTGFHPCRPTISRRFMPEPGSPEYAELETNPDLVYLKTITNLYQTIIGVSLIESLSTHSSDEVYLGQRDTPEWTKDQEALEAFRRFGEKLVEIENKIIDMNLDTSLKNRNGPVKVPYTLLYPNTSDLTGVGGLTGKGIPNSVTI